MAMPREGHEDAVDARIRVEYTPVFFSADWMREKYLGWRLDYDAPGIRIVSVRRGPARRSLIMAKEIRSERLGEIAARLKLFRPLSAIAFHDFSASSADPPPDICGRTFRLAPNSERCVNVNTFVVDLALSEEDAWRRVRQNARGAWKKARSLGTNVSFTRAPAVDELDAFFLAYRRMAAEKKLSVPDRREIEAMVKGGNLIVAHCRDAEGHTLVINLTYVFGDKSYYLHGVATERSKGEGQYVQWETIKHLKSTGVRWYDLGGVSSTDPKDGIFFFKRSMGGTLVPLGLEYIWTSKSFAIAAGLSRRFSSYSMARRILRKA